MNKLFRSLMLCFCIVPLMAEASTAADGLYLHAFGGPTFPNNIITGIESRVGFDFGGAIGYKENRLRYEAELNWQRNTMAVSIPAVASVSLRPNIFAIMANLHYDLEQLNFHPKFVPSVGVGIGWVHARVDGRVSILGRTFGGSGGDSSFAYQFMANLFYHLSSTISVNAGYKYFGTTGFTNLLNKKWQNHMLNFGLTCRLG